MNDIAARADAIARVKPSLAILVALSALQPLALNMLAPALPGMARTFSVDYATIQLTLTLYLLTVAVVQLIAGPASDRLGRRPVILVALGLYLIGSIGGAFALTVDQLIAARMVQAAGGGTTFALARALVRDTSERDEAASRIGYMTMAMVVIPMVAPLGGGFLDQRFDWHAIFAFMAGAGALVLAGATLRLRETHLRRDAAASVLETFRAFPVLLRSPAFLAYAGAMAFTSAAFFAFISGAPYVVVDVMGRTPEVYGAWFMLNAAGYMIGNFVSGRFGARLGADRMVGIGTMISMVAISVGMVLALLPGWSPALFFVPLALSAIGNGLTLPGSTAGALSVRPDLAGAAAGLTGALQLGVGALASAIVGLVAPLWPPGLVAVVLICVVLGWASFRLAGLSALRRG